MIACVIFLFAFAYDNKNSPKMLMRETSEGIHSPFNIVFFELNDIPKIMMLTNLFVGLIRLMGIICGQIGGAA